MQVRINSLTIARFKSEPDFAPLVKVSAFANQLMKEALDYRAKSREAKSRRGKQLTA